MDKHNTFFTRNTYNLVRLENFIFLLILTGLIIAFRQEVNWVRFAIAFLWMDVVGTFPALYWYYIRCEGEHRSIHPIFHVVYNIAHSFIVIAVLTGLWYLLTGAWEWAMLAMPIHLLGDRAIFGNIYKPLGLSFEPVPHRNFTRFLEEYKQSGRW